MKKDESLTILTGLPRDTCSLARSHYCWARELWTARFPFSPGSLLLRLTTWTCRTPPTGPCRCQLISDTWSAQATNLKPSTSSSLPVAGLQVLVKHPAEVSVHKVIFIDHIDFVRAFVREFCRFPGFHMPQCFLCNIDRRQWVIYVKPMFSFFIHAKNRESYKSGLKVQ